MQILKNSTHFIKTHVFLYQSLSTCSSKFEK